MDMARFKEIVSAFLDAPDDCEYSHGRLVARVGTDLIDAELSTRDGTIVVEEGGRQQTAERWIVNRLAMLDLLADRILASFKLPTALVAQRGEVLGASSDSPEPAPDAAGAVRTYLNRRPAGTCSVLYLTSDAGEGKTTLIGTVARDQAKRFKARETDWLLVPISLGGRAFLRFDDVVVAGLMNQLRFQRLYFDAFLQMVRLGVVVPALDGFEEVFVETSEGEAMTSLGTLMSRLRGEGTLLIAARTAFFEFRSMANQALLIDALPGSDVAFGRISLSRWSEQQFLDYCNQRGFQGGLQIYNRIAGKGGSDHPLLTRAVLASRLIDLETESPTRDPERAPSAPASSFGWLVDQMLEREAKQKWIGKGDDASGPLLSVASHRELLSLIAEEMWVSKSSTLPRGVVDSVAEVFAEQKALSDTTTRQVKERLGHHAMLVSAGPRDGEIAFDHDHFMQYFLGVVIASYISGGHGADLRKLFRIDNVPLFALETATDQLAGRHGDRCPLIDMIWAAAGLDEYDGFTRYNASTISMMVVDAIAGGPVVLNGATFPVDSLRARKISAVRFENCTFQSTSLDNTELKDCEFRDCDFEGLDVEESFVAQSSVLSGASSVRRLTDHRGNRELTIYDPGRIALLLVGCRLTLASPPVTALPFPEIDDPRLAAARKAILTFRRTTSATDGTFKLRLSNNSHLFSQQVEPALVGAGVLRLEGGKYRLGMSLARLMSALDECDGTFDDFLKRCEPGAG